MNAAHDELNHFSTFWLLSCILHAFILMMPIKVMLPKMPMSVAIEVARIDAPIVAEVKTQLRQPRRVSHYGQVGLRHVAVERKVTGAAESQPVKVAKRTTNGASSGVRITLQPNQPQPSQVEEAHPRRTRRTILSTPRAANEPSGKSVAPIAGVQIGALPRGSATYEAKPTGDVFYGVGVKRVASETVAQVDMPALGEGVTKGSASGGGITTASPMVGDIRKQPVGGVGKLPPAQLGVTVAQPAMRSTGSSGSESQGGYGVIAIGRSQGTTSVPKGEPGERPELTGDVKPSLSSSVAGAIGDSPAGVTRGIGGRGKSAPMVSELVGALAQVGEGSGITSGSLRQLKPQPRIAEPISREPQVKGYTGLIIDARGLKVERSMSPRIYDERGRAIYGPQMVPAHFAIEKGVVYYHTVLEDALKDPRAGPKPLIIKAVGVRGSANQDVIVSASDGEVILRENNMGHFLQRCNVIFIID